MRCDSHEFGRFEIGHDQHQSADELFRCVVFGNAGNNCPLFRGLDGQFEQFVRLGYFFRGNNLPNPQFYFAELVKGDEAVLL